MDLDRLDIGFLPEVAVYLHRLDDMEVDLGCDQGHQAHPDLDFDLENHDQTVERNRINGKRTKIQ